MTPMTPNQVLEQAIRTRLELARKQAALPIAEKLKKLVELQRFSLSARPLKGPDDRRRVWDLK